MATTEKHSRQSNIIDAEDRVVDEVLLAVMRAPRTFTREDTVEITCHGGMVASQAVLQTVLAAGARSEWMLNCSRDASDRHRNLVSQSIYVP
mgnify:CR=1 FL=1